MPLFAFAVGIASGCGGVDATSFCQKQESCRGGNSDDVKACEDLASAQQKLANDIGCSDEFKSSFDCNAAASTCQQGPTGFSCTTDVECDTGTATGTCTAGHCVTSASYGVETTLVCESQTAAYHSCLSL